MASNNDYKKIVSDSKLTGAAKGFSRDISYKVNNYFFKSRHSRFRKGFLVLSLAAMIGYAANKESVDNAADRFGDYLTESYGYVAVKKNKILSQRQLNNISDNLTAKKDEINNAKEKLYVLNEQISTAMYDVDSLHNIKKDLTSKISKNEKAIDNREREGLFSRIKNFFARFNNNEEYWLRVEPSSSLTSIAKNYYGDMSVYSEIAEINNIQSPYIIRVGQPLILPTQNILHKKSLRTSNVPLYEAVTKDEMLDDFLMRCNITAPIDEIRDYNMSKNNYVPKTRPIQEKTEVVYFKEKHIGR